MTLFRCLLAVSLLLSGCAASASAPGGSNEDDVTEEELRSAATSCSVREPLSGARLETLRREIGDAADGHAWTRNQGSVFAMQWETRRAAALGEADRVAIAQAAFTFHLRLGDPSVKNRRYLGQVSLVATTDAALYASVDHVGLSTSTPDADTHAARARVLDALRSAARTTSVTVLKATLHTTTPRSTLRRRSVRWCCSSASRRSMRRSGWPTTARTACRPASSRTI